MFDLNKKNKYFIVAPAFSATGGPELLHQLAFQLKNLGKDVYIFYVPKDQQDPVHLNYKEYKISYKSEIEDSSDNVLIVPETMTEELSNYKNISKVVWWLSIDNYFHHLPGYKGLFNRMLLNKLGYQKYLFFNRDLLNCDFHLVQSEYALNYLSQEYSITNVNYLSDYIHQSYMDMKINLSKKENIVAYNPLKGIKFTKKIIKFCPNITFVPIRNMTREEVVDLLQKAKVYIDFGFHPGKDRIPREAAILRCCVITNYRGSAGFTNDLSINENFKFKEKNSNLKNIKKRINECMENFEENLEKYNHYRNEIKLQKRKFDIQVKSLFTKI
tara:strand:+ start:2695 stop:3681 length:987 start_codon:yes stop_codon:yes gene_type:complete